MFGWGELGIIIVLAIILLGPDKLPEVARTAGKIYAEYKNAKRRLELELLYGYEIPNKDYLEELSRKKLDVLKKDLTSQLEVEGLNTGRLEDLKDQEGGGSNVHSRSE
ncbi:twin-arginine translocase TatA/TatE family subunit [Archaeoglobus veneficus]|uniref:Sec-independent translocation protein mttA/Hcf106 n=1 Tax=Archaeoglobus veneficus (strain DSM 11195 / SNP6) TaxID=693661 RepID=F2KNR7_ARCVS|nr:twin-arginine translocase TatA/TatE family subunit [Archaeoglobus veneficus]AEA47394.1 sec-independent translocation protein mttA/Hcf106 [Archaeoglobus veneficus SNP6]